MRRKTSCYAAPRMDASPGRVGPDHSRTASSRRTLAEDCARSASTPTQPFREQAPVGRWRQNENPRASVPPDVAAAKQRVGGLEAAGAALSAVGTVDGPEVQFLKEP